MTFSYPTEKLTETVSAVQTGGAAYRAKRRASMQDALDATMINTSLYDQIPVGYLPNFSLLTKCVQRQWPNALHYPSLSTKTNNAQDKMG